MIHSSYYKPVVMPVLADDVASEIDRLQELTASNSLNRTKAKEIGRVGTVEWRKSTPAVSLSLRQLEYGSLEFYRKLANKGPSVTQIDYTDFKSSAVDIAGYKTDDNGTFLGTVYYPNLRVSGMGLSIGDPDATIERSFSLVGEDELILQNSNKYLIFGRYTISSGGAARTVAISNPAPAADPDKSGRYMFKVVRVRAAVGTELVYGADWSYDGAETLSINGTSNAGDVILVWYSAATYISGLTPFTQNDADMSSIPAENVSIYLQSSNYVYRLQSVSVDTTFDRTDYKEIGNATVVSRGAREITSRITLGRILESWTIEEVLRGKAGLSYGKIDPRQFLSTMNLVIKIYGNSTKTQFKIGYKFLGLSPTALEGGTPTSDYVTRGITLECENAFVTSVEAVL